MQTMSISGLVVIPTLHKKYTVYLYRLHMR